MKLARTIIICTLVALGVFCLFTSYYTLDEEHAAVITTFGKAETETEAGLHFKIPFIQKVKKVDTTLKGMSIGYDLNTNASIPEESVMITSDYNFINVDFYIEYQTSDPIAFLYASDSPQHILKSVSQNCIRTVIASYPVDTVLTTGKADIQANIKSMLTEKMDALNVGLIVRNVTIQDAEPPTYEVDEAFRSVETAKQGKETALNNANKYKNEQLPAAEANVDKIIQAAEATAAKRVAEAEGQVARFNAMYNEYLKYPLITKERMFFEIMEEILPNMKIIIKGDNDDLNTLLPLDNLVNINK